MSKWGLGLAATLALALGVVIPTLAGAKASHNCAVDVTLHGASVKTNSGNPPLSGSANGAATVDGTVCGKAFHGANRIVTKYSSPGVYTETSRTFGPLGSWKATGSGSGTLNPNGSASISGSDTIAGGTGIYTGATGKLTYTGHENKNSPRVTLHVSGNIKY